MKLSAKYAMGHPAMSSVLRPSTPDDELPILELLARIFGFPTGDGSTARSLLRWKYWEPRADFGEPRSFVMEKNGRIVAHIGLWPVRVPVGSGSERGIHMIDWVSDPQSPGAGVALLQRAAKSYDFVYAIGGTEMTQSILPRFGFRKISETLTWARPIRPWRQAVQHQTRDLRLPLRLARNVWWSRVPARAAEPGWDAAEADPKALPGERDVSFFRYLQRCPAACSMTFRVSREGKRAGCFVLSFVQQQARLAGVWLDEPTTTNWNAVFRLAQQAALKHSAAAEFTARCATDASKEAAGAAGLRVRRHSPVFLFRKDKGAGTPPLQYQLVDNDAVFHLREREGFLT